MKAERFRQIRNLFDATVERDPETRNVFLREACRDDEELLVEVGKLLAAQGHPTSWIDESVLGEPLRRLEGKQIGPYEVLRQLGEGGMGAVYLAAHDEGGVRKLVALKMVRRDAAFDAVLQRFKRERQILEVLDHPNIAAILGAGTTDDGLPYLVMDYVDGQPIDQYCDERQLDLNERMKLFRDVCAAVQYAHEHRVVHRDLKPSNVLVTRDGVVKLLDFGIARLAESGPGGATALTRSDMLMMTPEYASPEQVCGAIVTPRSDVYALGVVLYELLTGRRPYRLRSRVFREIAGVICEESPDRPSTAVAKKSEDASAQTESFGRVRGSSPAELQRSLVGNIDCILLKALQKDPANRYATVRQLSQDLQRHAEGGAVAARRDASRNAVAQFGRRNGWWLTAVVAVALMLLTGTIVIPWQGLFVLAAIGIVFIGGYFLGTWERGEAYARTTLLVVAKLLPVIAIAALAQWWIIKELERFGARGPLGIVVVFTSLTCGFSIYRWVQWTKRDQLGPIVLELEPRQQKIGGLIALATMCLLVLVMILDDGLSKIGQTVPVVLNLAPLAILMLTLRNQIRQRGVVWFGGQIPWRTVLSSSWEPGRGRLEGQFDVLRLKTNNRDPRGVEFLIPVRERERVAAVVDQQLMEWPS